MHQPCSYRHAPLVSPCSFFLSSSLLPLPLHLHLLSSTLLHCLTTSLLLRIFSYYDRPPPFPCWVSRGDASGSKQAYWRSTYYDYVGLVAFSLPVQPSSSPAFAFALCLVPLQALSLLFSASAHSCDGSYRAGRRLERPSRPSAGLRAASCEANVICAEPDLVQFSSSQHPHPTPTLGLVC